VDFTELYFQKRYMYNVKPDALTALKYRNTVTLRWTKAVIQNPAGKT
jgi:hypothetical protein